MTTYTYSLYQEGYKMKIIVGANDLNKFKELMGEAIKMANGGDSN